ncbi:carboxypeptidase-like regulatory domain-containing protein [Roseimaritima ulvae]|uniref:Carboxypeptidase regulatory-like domain-containing protein n=1 Tax=Roseimaritima ulvae TaxID=980254 RepID=A0A5B9QLR6_9BACT|nr:carboxypeptidase-like regulatory domain-containing protein [Roseimaritima ulvae]QEG38752.1 hypothetical protein UC8_07100 [Roseimaritima ulvae]
MIRAPHLITWALCCTTLAGGCAMAPSADYSDVGLLHVGGQVTLDNQPLENATVRFESPDATYSYAVTDARGNYTLMFDSIQPGVTPGKKVVRITSLPTAESNGAEIEELEDADAPAAATQSERVPARYNQASELQVDVTESDRNVDFHLTSDA